MVFFGQTQVLTAGLASLVVLSTLACDDQGPPTCKEEKQAMSSLDTPATPTGQTGQAFLDLALGTYPVTLTMRNDASSGSPFVRFQPQVQQTQGTLKISYAQGVLEQVTSTPTNCEGVECASLNLECQGRLEAPVIVELVTDSGAFNERWPARLLSVASQQSANASQTKHRARLALSFSPQHVAGSFRISFQKPAEQPCLNLVYQHGHLDLHFEQGKLMSSQLTAITRTECEGYKVTQNLPLYEITATQPKGE